MRSVRPTEFAHGGVAFELLAFLAELYRGNVGSMFLQFEKRHAAAENIAEEENEIYYLNELSSVIKDMKIQRLFVY